MTSSSTRGLPVRPKVTVVVVTYNSEDVLPGFFAALPEGLAAVDSFEVVVADNDSSDRSVDVVKESWPDATIVMMGRNAGYAAAINAAVAAAKPSDAIMVLNDDIELGRESVRRLIEAVDRPGIGIAVPRLVDGDGRLLKSMRREPTVLRVLGEAVLGGTRAGRYDALGEIVESEHRYEAASEADWASGCAWLITRECWDRVGPWDESFFLYAEDTDYALRARDRGFRLRYEPSATAVHLVGPSHEVPRLWAMSVWNRYRLYNRRHGRAASAAFRASLLLNEGIRSLAGSAVHRAGFAALIRPRSRPDEVR
jgi:GT2 family glycosyltransferase